MAPPRSNRRSSARCRAAAERRLPVGLEPQPAGLTNRGLGRRRIYDTTDGVTWFSLTPGKTVELPPADGRPLEQPFQVANVAANRLIASVIVAADATGGNYGGNAYGLSAVRFMLRD